MEQKTINNAKLENKTKYVNQLSLQDFVELFQNFGMKYCDNSDCKILKKPDGTFDKCQISCDYFTINILDDYNCKVAMFDNAERINSLNIFGYDISRACNYLSLSPEQLISAVFAAYLMEKFPDYEKDWNKQFEKNEIAQFSSNKNQDLSLLKNPELVKEFANMFNKYKVDSLDNNPREQISQTQLENIARHSNKYMDSIKLDKQHQFNLEKCLEKFGKPFIKSKSTFDKSSEYIEIECDDLTIRIYNAFNFNFAFFDNYEGYRTSPTHEISFSRLDKMCNSLGISRAQLLSAILASHFSTEFPEYKNEWKTLLENGIIPCCSPQKDEASFNKFPNNGKLVEIAKKINGQFVSAYENTKNNKAPEKI